MERYEPGTYGDRIADIYDGWHPFLAETTGPTVDLLASLAGGGPVLELAVGTGRVAIPLADRGLEVHGIDASQAMVQRLRAKPGGDKVKVVMGDMADVGVEGEFSLVFVVFNTFFALLTQDDQLRCFANVAARLAPSGRFVLECFVPDLKRFERGQSISVTGVELDRLRLDASRHHQTEQRVDAQQVVITHEGVRMLPVALRYAWPSELDLMARLAGLRLGHRWGGWGREPFGDDSGIHVSVYEKPAAS
jgi:SAM-dependent methyltransferase